MRRSLEKSTPALLLAFLSILLSGCLRTELQAPEPVPAALRLSRLGTPLRLEISSRSSDVSGTQFLLFVIPFGRSTLVNPDNYFTKASLAHFSQAGFNTLRTNNNNQLSLQVEIKELSTTAFDFLFFRKVVARAHFEFLFLDRKGKVLLKQEVKETASDYRRFGFNKELNKTLHQAIERALTPTLSEMRSLCNRGKRCKY